MNVRIKEIFLNSLRSYFAPLTGAIDGACKAVKAEMERHDRTHPR